MLTIYSIVTSPRLEYICDVLLKEQLGLDFIITCDENTLNGKFVINYSDKHINNSFQITPHRLLFEKGIIKQPIEIFEYKNHYGFNSKTTAFFSATSSDFPFDIFASAFYLLSRYEEYLTHEKDSYGRFAHDQSLAYQHGFLHLPLVNIWIQDLKKALQSRFSDIAFNPPKARTILTYDIDIAWSYKNKGLIRNLGGFFRKPEWERLSAIAGLKKDPFDSYDFMDHLHRNVNAEVVYFFLVAKKNSRYDKNISPDNKNMMKLISSTAGKYMIGLHPSWSSNSSVEKLAEEKNILENIAGKKIIISRQHYIRFNLPETFRNLIEAGIEKDYSMGYGSINGFRASFAGSFYWYDLKGEKITSLRLYPFCYMDANSHYEQSEDAKTSFRKMMQLKQECDKTNGLFISIFHNNFLGAEKQFDGWADIYSDFISQLR